MARAPEAAAAPTTSPGPRDLGRRPGTLVVDLGGAQRGLDGPALSSPIGSAPSPPAPERKVLRVVMHKARYDRVCGAGGGRRFVVFAPWYEQSDSRSEGGVKLLLAPLAEALP